MNDAQAANSRMDNARRTGGDSDWRDANGRFLKGRPLGRPKGAMSRARRLWAQAIATTPPKPVQAAGIERLWFEEVYHALRGDDEARRQVFGMLRMKTKRLM